MIRYRFLTFCSADQLVCVSVGSLCVTGDRIALTDLTRSAKTPRHVHHKLFVADRQVAVCLVLECVTALVIVPTGRTSSIVMRHAAPEVSPFVLL
jgi:hypothetical protein